MGRRRKDLGKRKQLNIEDEGESVWYALPKQKRKKIGQAHSLALAVEQNKAGAKKH